MTGTEDAERARDRISMEAVKFKSQRADALPPSAKTRSWDFLPKCNENAPVRMRVCAACSSHFYRAKFIPQLSVNRRTIIFTDSGNDAGSVLNGNGK